MRRLDHRDANEPGIIAALERRRCVVWRLSQGGGTPDLLVGVPARGRLVLMLLEVKDGTKVASKQKLRASQEAFAERFKGAPVFKVTTPREALERVREIRVREVEHQVERAA